MPLSTFEGEFLVHSGTVTAVERVEQTQTMYNLTVDTAHTFFVGEGEWLVHNTNCPRFIAGANIENFGKTVGGDGLVDLKPTLDRIAEGTKFPHRNDGSTFRNREGLLPQQPNGYYTEYVHPTSGVNGPGPQRLIYGNGGEIYYTPDHYGSFIQVK